MDPFTITYALLSFINIAQRTATLFQKVRKVEGSKVDRLYYRLISEKKRTEGWANHIRASNSLQSSIPSEVEKDVRELLGKLEHYYANAAMQFEKIYIAKSDTAKGYVERIRLAYGGFDDLQGIVDTLGAMNSALEAIAPPLPPYSPGNRSLPARTLVETNISEMRERPWRPQASGSPSIRESGSTPMAPSMLAAGISRPLVSDLPAGEQTRVGQHPLVYSLYISALNAMRDIANSKQSERLLRTAQRLQIWGAGIFHGPYSLDRVLVSNPAHNGPLRDCLLRTFVKLLILEGMQSEALLD